MSYNHKKSKFNLLSYQSNAAQVTTHAQVFRELFHWKGGMVEFFLKNNSRGADYTLYSVSIENVYKVSN